MLRLPLHVLHGAGRPCCSTSPAGLSSEALLHQASCAAIATTLAAGRRSSGFPPPCAPASVCARAPRRGPHTCTSAHAPRRSHEGLSPVSSTLTCQVPMTLLSSSPQEAFSEGGRGENVGKEWVGELKKKAFRNGHFTTPNYGHPKCHFLREDFPWSLCPE